MSFLDQPSFADDVRAVLVDLLALPPAFMDYTVQYNALNGLPIPLSQITGFHQQNIVSSQSFTDSGSADFSDQGLWLVEIVYVLSNAVIGTAVVHIGTNTNDGSKSVTVIASGPNTGTGLNPTLAAVNNNTASGAFRVSTAGATGKTITVTYRRLQT